MLTKLFQAAAATALMTMSAHAADIEAPAVHDWSGFYVGAYGGVAWTDAEIDGTIFNDGGFPNINSGILDLVNGVNDPAFSNTTGTYGVQAGYNIQLDRIVLGIQVDFGSLDVGDDDHFTTFEGEDLRINLDNSFDTDWMLTIRPRIGMAFDRLLVYATGGAALTELKFQHHFEAGPEFSTAFAAEGFSETSSRWGWVAGAGLEYAADDNWSFALEYLYSDFGSLSEERRIFFGESTPLFTVFRNELALVVQTVRGSINYKF